MRGIWVFALSTGCPATNPEGDDDDDDVVTASGTWTGDCDGTWIETGPTTSYDVSFPMILELTEEDGALTGSVALDGDTTADPVAVTGTREDAAVVLEAPESDANLGYRFELTLEGDALTGSWAFVSSTSEVQDPLDCTLGR